MDALDRIGPIARPLLSRVDATLIRHGAPPDHPVWTLLRRLGTVPGEAVEFFARAEPAELLVTAAQLHAQAERYASAPIPLEVHWHGTAGEAYAAQASALAAHLASMIDRLRTTADYTEAVAVWYGRSRDGMAMTLADILASAEAVVLRSVTDPQAAVATSVVAAAADVGAHLLSAVADARADGHDLLYEWRGRLDALAYRPPASTGPYRFDTTIDLSH